MSRDTPPSTPDDETTYRTGCWTNTNTPTPLAHGNDAAVDQENSK
jgi:hypothetical protein